MNPNLGISIYTQLSYFSGAMTVITKPLSHENEKKEEKVNFAVFY